MGVLSKLESGQTHTLTAETTVGRSAGADLTLREDFVSSMHASIQWVRRGWAIKDLGSHNGTYVNGDLVPPGTRRQLRESDEITFGQSSATWTLSDAAPPEPLAIGGDGSRVTGEAGMLVLRDPEQPTATIYQDGLGQWRVEIDGESRDATDREILDIDGVQYTIRLPDLPVATRTARSGRPLTLAEVELTVEVGGEEPPFVSAHSEDGDLSFAIGATSGVLAALARHRIGGEGWIARDALLDELSIGGRHLNVLVYRLRRIFADAGFLDAARIVERDKARLRLGPGRVQLR